MIETAFDISIEDKLWLAPDAEENRFDGIMTGASWSKAITVGFKHRFPRRL